MTLYLANCRWAEGSGTGALPPLDCADLPRLARRGRTPRPQCRCHWVQGYLQPLHSEHESRAGMAYLGLPPCVEGAGQAAT
eukprot:1943445-Pyramimonas_sp.AAC.1